MDYGKFPHDNGAGAWGTPGDASARFLDTVKSPYLQHRFPDGTVATKKGDRLYVEGPDEAANAIGWFSVGTRILSRFDCTDYLATGRGVGAAPKIVETDGGALYNITPYIAPYGKGRFFVNGITETVTRVTVPGGTTEVRFVTPRYVNPRTGDATSWEGLNVANIALADGSVNTTARFGPQAPHLEGGVSVLQASMSAAVATGGQFVPIYVRELNGVRTTSEQPRVDGAMLMVPSTVFEVGALGRLALQKWGLPSLTDPVVKDMGTFFAWSGDCGATWARLGDPITSSLLARATSWPAATTPTPCIRPPTRGTESTTRSSWRCSPMAARCSK